MEQLTFVPTQGGLVGLAFRAADEAGVGAELEVQPKVNVVNHNSTIIDWHRTPFIVPFVNSVQVQAANKLFMIKKRRD